MNPSVLGFLLLVELLLLHLMVLSCSSSSNASPRPLRCETNDQATLGKEASLTGGGNIEMTKHRHPTTSANGEADGRGDMQDMGEMEEEEEVGCGREEGSKEECLKRRMMADAHLDYIYTQRHSHP